jgi:acetolactate synthase-1/2/3 large subunit
VPQIANNRGMTTQPITMNGAESLVHTLVANGISVCFANPGTSEMHFVAALDRIPGIRCVPGMQENVVTGMADGYGRIAQAPAATLLHCGPGFANGIANLHNARKARSPVVNIVGDQATYHAGFAPPLAMATQTSPKPCRTGCAPPHGQKRSAVMRPKRCGPPAAPPARSPR